MTRQQAENILDGYVEMELAVELHSEDSTARESLREVFLDAMTETRYYPYVTTTPADITYTPKDHQWPHVTTVPLNASDR